MFSCFYWTHMTVCIWESIDFWQSLPSSWWPSMSQPSNITKAIMSVICRLALRLGRWFLMATTSFWGIFWEWDSHVVDHHSDVNPWTRDDPRDVNCHGTVAAGFGDPIDFMDTRTERTDRCKIAWRKHVQETSINLGVKTMVSWRYCGWRKCCTSWQLLVTMKHCKKCDYNWINDLPTDAGLLPSTVCYLNTLK